MVDSHSPFVTLGQIASALNEPLHRVQHVVNTRSSIHPIGRAGIIRVYDPTVIEEVRRELDRIDARRCNAAGSRSTAGPAGAQS